MGLFSSVKSFFGINSKKIEARAMISVRMEAIGGQGANSAGKILAEAAVLGMKYTGNHFSSFGSEKRGSHVRSFVRFSPSKKIVRSASFIERPQILVIFQDALILRFPEVLEGVEEDTILILNTSLAPRQLRWPRGTKLKKITTIDGDAIARENQCGLNSVMLGACFAFLPEIEKPCLEDAFRRYFSKLPNSLIMKNIQGFRAATSRVIESDFYNELANVPVHDGAFPRLGVMNAPIGGLILNPGNTILKDNSATRKGVMPRFLKDLCFHCGYCDMVCPDYCFVWSHKEGEAPRLQGIDYQFCKGCQKCVVACPVQALTPVSESEVPQREKNVQAFPEVSSQIVGERWQRADWSKVVGEMGVENRMLTLEAELLDPNSYIRPDFSKIAPELQQLKDKNEQITD